jgi:hypothetical protein
MRSSRSFFKMSGAFGASTRQVVAAVIVIKPHADKVYRGLLLSGFVRRGRQEA